MMLATLIIYACVLILIVNLGTREETHFATADGFATIFNYLHIECVVLHLLHVVVETFTRLCLLHICNHKAVEIVSV